MKLETEKAFKRRSAIQKKKQIRQSLQPTADLQPKVKGIHYDNVRSARAEEALLGMLLKEPQLFEACGSLSPEEFSSPLLAKAYGHLQQLYFQGRPAGLPALADQCSSEEMTHLSAVAQKNDELINEDALADYIDVIRQEHSRKNAGAQQDLLAIRDQLKEKKGYGGI